jgi:4-cresol dehydrogenase (hydroxylating)
MTVWLMPAPERFQAFFFTASRPESLAGIIEALRPLRLDGTLRSVAHIGNDYKVLTATSQYPWEDTAGATPLRPERMAAIRAALGAGCWNGSGGLYGTRAQVREGRRRLRRALRGKVDRLQFVDDRLIAIMARFAGPFRLLTGWDVRRTLAVLRPVYGLLKGVPTDDTLASAYWRKRHPAPPDPDPDRDGCGLLWSSPVLPNTGEAAAEVAELTSRILLSHGFEPQMSISIASERVLVCVITISYDRAVPGEDERADVCYKALNRELLERGYPPYRLSIAGMGQVTGRPDYDAIVRRMKEALDPSGILAPGRYQGGVRQIPPQ